MIIHVVLSSRELFGADRSAVELGVVLATLSHDVTLVLPAHRPELGLADHAASRGLAVEEQPVVVASSRGVEGAVPRLRSGRAQRTDLIIANTSAVVGDALSGARMTMLREWIHPSSLTNRALVKFHARRSQHVISVSEGALAQWEAASSRQSPRRSVIPNWLPEGYAQSHGFSPEAKSGILCLGRFNAWKGQGLLLSEYRNAFNGVDDAPDLTFLGVQTGTRFEAFVDELKADSGADRVRFAEFEDDPRAELARAAMVVVPSVHPEPFGRVVIEAAAMGCKVLAFEGGGPDQMARDLGPAVKVVSRNPGSLAAALSDWNKAGASGQSVAEVKLVTEALAARYSPTVARESWSRVLGEVR